MGTPAGAVPVEDPLLRCDVSRILKHAHRPLDTCRRAGRPYRAKRATGGVASIRSIHTSSHILRNMERLPGIPVFRTREQTGGEACPWLLFDHKYPYLRATSGRDGTNSILPHIHTSAGLKEHSATAHTSHLLAAKVQFLTEMIIIGVDSAEMTRPRDHNLYDVALLTFGQVPGRRPRARPRPDSRRQIRSCAGDLPVAVQGQADKTLPPQPK